MKISDFWSRWGGFIALALIYTLVCSLESCSYV